MALHFESEFITESVRVPVETYYLLKTNLWLWYKHFCYIFFGDRG